MKALTPLKFIVKTTMSGNQIGFFDWGVERDFLFKELQDLYSKRQNNESFTLTNVLDVYKKDQDFFPALIMLGELFLNMDDYEQGSRYLKIAIKIAEQKIPDNYTGKVYSVEFPFSLFSAIKGLYYCEKQHGDVEFADKCREIGLTRFPAWYPEKSENSLPM